MIYLFWTPAGIVTAVAYSSKTHHIRVDSITNIVTQQLSSIIKLVVDEHYKQIQINQRRNQKALQTTIAREKEVELPEMSKSQKDSLLKAFGRNETDRGA